MSGLTYQFKVCARLNGGSDGEGLIKTSLVAPIGFGVPAQMGGAPQRTDPEELLLSAVSACYTITLSLIYERDGLTAPDLELDAFGQVERQPDRSLKFTQITLRPTIFISNPNEKQLAEELAASAEKQCFISNIVRATVPISVEPIIITKN
ncbi:MAG: OsmC family protein [Armatimonadetes bacterium]|nr:OsmC family protein [Armatimonadota bacterium]